MWMDGWDWTLALPMWGRGGATVGGWTVDSGQRTADSDPLNGRAAAGGWLPSFLARGLSPRSPPALQGYYSGLEHHPGPEQPPVVPAGPLYSQAAMTCRPVIASIAVDDEPTWVGDTLRSRRWAIGDQAALGELPCLLCAFHYLPT